MSKHVPEDDFNEGELFTVHQAPAPGDLRLDRPATPARARRAAPESAPGRAAALAPAEAPRPDPAAFRPVAPSPAPRPAPHPGSMRFDPAFDTRPERPAAPGPVNPLARFFRTPGIMLNLPSGGRYLPQGSFHPHPEGMIEILPFRAADELVMRSPDALLSGMAIEEMIRSCVPAITCDPKLVSGVDLDVLLLGVRAASYGKTMEIEPTCPSCKQSNSYEIDIPGLLATAKETSAENDLRVSSELVVYLRPFNIANVTRLQMASFAAKRALQAAETDEDRQKVLGEHVLLLQKLNLELTADCIMAVVTPDAVVKDPGFIFEWAANAKADVIKAIGERVKRLSEGGVDKVLPVTCRHCNHEWEAGIEFDPASFFAQGS